MIAVLVLVTMMGSIIYLDTQETIPPDNPIKEKIEIDRVPIVQGATTQVDEEILELESDVTEAEKDEYKDSEALFDKDQFQSTATDLKNQLNESAGIGNTSNSDGNKGERTSKAEGANGVKGDENDLPDTPGSGGFELPTDINYFFVDIIDLQDPYTSEDPRCFYEITHVFSELEVVKVVLLNNGEPTSHFGGTANQGWINLNSGENWLSVQVSYQLTNGEVKTFERATEPAMVILRDPLDIYMETNLKDAYDNPAISFQLRTDPSDAYVQVYIRPGEGNERLVSIDENGNLNTTLSKGENTFRFVASANGWNPTETTKKVIYYETKINVYSPELAGLDYRTSGYNHYEKDITFSTRVEDAETGQAVSGTRMDIYLGNTLVRSLIGGDHDAITLTELPLGLKTITIVARGSNSNNNSTEFKTAQYQILVGQGESTPTEVLDKTITNSNLGDETIVHEPILDFRISPVTVNTTGESYPITEHKVYTYHTSQISSKTPVIMRENIMGLFCYTVNLNQGLNVIDLVLLTDELYEIHYQYKVYYIPQDVSPEPLGTIYLSVDASSIGLPGIAAGYIDIYPNEPLSYAVLDLLKQHGYQTAYTGQSNYSMYLQAIIRNGMMAGWEQSQISEEERARLEAAGGAAIWHGSYDINSLGEGDFTTKSGWLFTLNGIEIRGLSNEFPQDGDVCIMRFSLTGN